MKIQIERPAAYEVFQRRAGRALVSVRIAGLTQAGITVLALDGARRVAARCEFDVRHGAVCGEMEVPEGGWYWLAVSGERRRRQRLTPFGVGDVFVVAGQSIDSRIIPYIIQDRVQSV